MDIDHDGRMADTTRRFYAQAQEIEGNRDLSDEGKANALTELWDSTTQKLDKLETEKREADATRLREVRTRLFGVPHWASEQERMSLREARRHAAAIDKAEVLDRELARYSDEDPIMAKALLERAVDLGWHRQDAEAVVERYAEQNPKIAEDLREFIIATAPQDAQTRLERQMRTRPTKPARIRYRPSAMASQS